MTSFYSTVNVRAPGQQFAVETSPRGAAARAAMCCGLTGATGCRSRDCHGSSPSDCRVMKSGSSGAPITAPGPPWQLFRTSLGFASHRVIWPDLGRRLTAAVPAADLLPLNTVDGIATRDASDAAALAALLNSGWLTALARLVADPARGGVRRFNASVARRPPVPPAGAAAWAALSRRGM